MDEQEAPHEYELCMPGQGKGSQGMHKLDNESALEPTANSMHAS